MFRNEKKDRIQMNMPTETLKIVVRTLYTGQTDIHIENVQVRFSPLKEERCQH